MTLNLRVHKFMRRLEANDIQTCLDIARTIEAPEDDFAAMVARPEVRTNAALLDAFGSNPALPRYWIFEHIGGFNPHRMTAEELDLITETTPDWHHYNFIVKQPYLRDETIVAKCQAVGWDGDDMLMLARCQRVAASRAIAIRTTRQDVRDLLLVNRVVF